MDKIDNNPSNSEIVKKQEVTPAKQLSGEDQKDMMAIMAKTQFLSKSIDSVNVLVDDVNQMVKSITDMQIAVKQIDSELEKFKTETGAKLDKFKLQVPLLDKQMDNISNRIDKITDRILSLTDDDMSEQTLKKQSVLMSALSTFNDSFNNLVMKLMEF